MKKIALMFLLFVSVSYAQSYSGVWSSEGDINNKYIMNLNLFQAGAKISGIVEYDVYGFGKLNFDVSGYVKNGVAYVRFRDKKNEVVCDGRFKADDNKTIFFKKSRGYNYVPTLTYLSIVN